MSNHTPVQSWLSHCGSKPCLAKTHDAEAMLTYSLTVNATKINFINVFASANSWHFFWQNEPQTSRSDVKGLTEALQQMKLLVAEVGAEHNHCSSQWQQKPAQGKLFSRVFYSHKNLDLGTFFDFEINGILKYQCLTCWILGVVGLFHGNWDILIKPDITLFW